MALITMPSETVLQPVWTPRPTVQVNRSSFNNGSRRVLDFDNGFYSAAASIMPVSTEPQRRAWRSFYSRLRGPANTFHLPVSTCPQHVLANPRLSAPLGGQTFANYANTTFTTKSITKSSGADLTWNASAIVSGDPSFGSGIAVSTRVNNLTNVFALGLREGANASASYGEIHYALHQDAANLFIMKLGVATLLGTVAVGDVVAVIYLIDTIYLLKNGVVLWSEVTTTGRLFRFDTSLYKSGTQITDIGFGMPGSDPSSIWLLGMPVGALLIPTGDYGTVPLIGGAAQLVMFSDDVFGTADGYENTSFEPALRGVPAIGAEVETKNPYAVLALTPASPPPDESNGVMTWAFEAEEAF